MCVPLSERRQSEPATYCKSATIGHSGKVKTMETVKRSVAAGGWKVGRDEETEHRMFTGSESTLYDTILVHICTSLHAYPKPQKGQHQE